jgi:hypothetical protein
MSSSTAFDRFILDDRIADAIGYLRARREDYEQLVKMSPISMWPSIVLAPVTRIALLDGAPGRRVSVAMMPNRVELIVDEPYGGAGQYTTEVYIIKDVRQAFAWFLAAYW